MQAALAARRSSKSSSENGGSAAAAVDVSDASSAPAAAQAAVLDTPAVSLDKLINSNSIATTQAAYDNILASLGIPTKERSLAKVAEALIPQLPHRSKQLLTALQARAAAVAAIAKQPKRRATVAVAIVGAGPVGLRTAIELAFLGCRVEVLEARDGFSRLQVLHLWEWVEADLSSSALR